MDGIGLVIVAFRRARRSEHATLTVVAKILNHAWI